MEGRPGPALRPRYIVPIEGLSPKGREIFALAEPILTLAQIEPKRIREIHNGKRIKKGGVHYRWPKGK